MEKYLLVNQIEPSFSSKADVSISGFLQIFCSDKHVDFSLYYKHHCKFINFDINMPIFKEQKFFLSNLA